MVGNLSRLSAIRLRLHAALQARVSSGDRDATAVLSGRVAHLKDKTAKFKQQMQSVEAIGEQLKASGDGQISLTDPDARSMATSGRGTGIVGYYVQAAVDAKHHLIVAHEVINVGHDRNQLASMAKVAKAAAGEDELSALADRGYYEGYEILGCERAGVAARCTAAKSVEDFVIGHGAR